MDDAGKTQTLRTKLGRKLTGRNEMKPTSEVLNPLAQDRALEL